jgi:hypothetical protein
MKWLIWGLILPVVQHDAANWTNNLDEQCILVSILSVNRKLESVKSEDNASESKI